MRKVVAISFGLLVVVAGPAAAKMPPFETTVEVEGDQALITVVMEGYDPGVGEFNDLVGLYSAAAMDDAAIADFTPITLTRIGPFTYQGTVTIPSNGEWAVVPFPGTASSFEPKATVPPDFVGEIPELYPIVWFSAVNVPVETNGVGSPNLEPTVQSPVVEPIPDIESPPLNASEGGVTVLPFTGDSVQVNRRSELLSAAVIAVIGMVVLVSAAGVVRYHQRTT